MLLTKCVVRENGYFSRKYLYIKRKTFVCIYIYARCYNYYSHILYLNRFRVGSYIVLDADYFYNNVFYFILHYKLYLIMVLIKYIYF